MIESEVLRVMPQRTDVSMLNAIGTQHSFSSAIADLVDNSIDASAETVRIQFLTQDGYLKRVRVRDDGRGMSPENLYASMDLRPSREYLPSDLGYFGFGMKSASMSQAGVLRVFTKDESGTVSSVRIRRQDAGGEFQIEILKPERGPLGYKSYARNEPGSGTVIEWDVLDSVSTSKKVADRDRWLSSKFSELEKHLGLIFHRFLGTHLRIFIEEWDLSEETSGPAVPIKKIDPFDFTSGRTGFPAPFRGRTASKEAVEMKCYVLSPGLESASVKINGLSREQWGGFYVYRKNRLIQAGGWDEFGSEKKRDLQLSRIQMEISDVQAKSDIKLTVEKDGVKFSSDMQRAVRDSKSATLGGITFEDYLQASRELYKSSNKRSQFIKPMNPVHGNENRQLSEAVSNAMGFKAGEPGFQIISSSLRSDQIFEVVVEDAVLKINSDLFEAGAPLDSEPAYEFFKAAMYLLMESHFSKQHITKATEEKIDSMHRVLALALGLQQLSEPTFSSVVIPSPAALAGRVNPASTVKPIARQLGLSEEATRKLFLSLEEESVAAEGLQPRNLGEDREMPAITRHPEPEHLEPAQPGQTRLQVSGLSPQAIEITKDTDLARLGYALCLSYREQRDLFLVSEANSRTENEVAVVLTQLLLPYKGELNDEAAAALNEVPLNAGDRERILNAFKDGKPLERIGADLSRTVLTVAKVILSSPRANVRVSKELLKALRKATR